MVIYKLSFSSPDLFEVGSTPSTETSTGNEGEKGKEMKRRGITVKARRRQSGRPYVQ